MTFDVDASLHGIVRSVPSRHGVWEFTYSSERVACQQVCEQPQALHVPRMRWLAMGRGDGAKLQEPDGSGNDLSLDLGFYLDS